LWTGGHGNPFLKANALALEGITSTIYFYFLGFNSFSSMYSCFEDLANGGFP
jgi:hypothetical protein